MRQTTKPQILHLANAEDEKTGNASEVIQFRKVTGGRGLLHVPREQAMFDTAAVARQIVAKNGVLSRDPDEAKSTVEKALSGDPQNYWLHVRTEGWRPDMKTFVHQGRAIGDNDAGSAILKGPISAAPRSYALATKGSLAGWRELVDLAQNSSRMRLGLCAAFAAPLLKVVDLQSFIINIAGPSKAGKSTILVASASVIGIGREGMLPNFNSTLSSLQEVASDFNDLLMPVNEIGLLKGAKRDAYQNLRPLIYRYAEGRDTSRHSTWTASSIDGAASWHGIMIASSENSIERLAGLAGEKRDEGEYARAFDVPAVHRGNPTVMDRFPADIPFDKREKWARKQLADIREVCKNNYGVAFARYLQFLTANHASLKLDVDEAMAAFLRSLRGEGQTGALQHAARNFALIYAAAVMANRAGLVPWNLRHTRGALKACYRAGLLEAARTEMASERAKKTITRHIRGLMPIERVTNVSQADGWFKLHQGRKLYCVRTEALRRWLASKEEELAALGWMRRDGLLRMKEGAVPNLPNVEWAITHSKVGSKGYRCYQFFDPQQSPSGM